MRGCPVLLHQLQGLYEVGAVFVPEALPVLRLKRNNVAEINEERPDSVKKNAPRIGARQQEIVVKERVYYLEEK